jgi:hypothetical protein
MRKGTTPTHSFAIPIETETIQAVEVTYCQNKQIVIQKNINDCVMEGKTIQTTLTQNDTMKFKDDVTVEIQIRVKDDNGTVFASDIMSVACQRCLSSEVLA